MSIIEARERLPGSAGDESVAAELSLPFDLRQKSRMRARLSSGEDIAIDLPRGTVLRGGDLLRLGDGRLVRVLAQPEQVMQVTCADPRSLAAAAYHLGNRHVPLQIGAAWLRLARDHVLQRMLEGMGASVTLLQAAFEPEAGAYGSAAGSGHGHGPGVIHDHAAQSHHGAGH